jgi:hypothetical protein
MKTVGDAGTEQAVATLAALEADRAARGVEEDEVRRMEYLFDSLVQPNEDPQSP